MLERVDEIRLTMLCEPTAGRAELEVELNQAGVQTTDKSTNLVKQMIEVGEWLQGLGEKSDESR